MSTYIPPDKKTFDINAQEAPEFLKKFLRQLATIDNLAPRSVCTYYIQLREFCRWVKSRGRSFTQEQFRELAIMDVLEEDLLCLNQDDLIEYLAYTAGPLNNKVESRALKLSALKRFYTYEFSRKMIAVNPTDGIVRPRKEKHLPVYMTLEQSQKLLSSIKGEFPERDYCIITFFLNCGMRLSELAAINLSDISDDELRIFGKGRKERIVYLNDACLAALDEYLFARSQIRCKIEEPNALWLSKRTGKRLTGRRIEQMVNDQMRAAGLGSKGFSPHKLRHTAATLMYQNGSAQLLELANILGHANTTTTEIYTHLHEDQLRGAMLNAPLAGVKRETHSPNYIAEKERQENEKAQTSLFSKESSVRQEDAT